MAIDFSLSEDEKMLWETANEFAQKEIVPNIRVIEEKGISAELRKKATEIGLLGIEFPESLGGAGLGMFQRALVTEAISSGDPGAAYSLFIHLPYSYFLLELGNDEMKEKYLKPVITGTKKACLLRSEFLPDEVITPIKWTKTDGNYKLSGRGIIEVDNPDFVLIPAKCENKVGFFLLDGLKDVEVGKTLHRCGVESSPAIEILLKDVEVKKEMCLTEDALSHENLWRAVVRTRLFISSLLLGLAKTAQEYSLKYAMERVAFEQPIAKHQAISFMLADDATQVEAIRLILWKALYEFDKNSGTEDKSVKSSVIDWSIEAYLQAVDYSSAISADAVQILGGHGYIKDHPVEKWMRDVRELTNAFGRPEAFRIALENL
jgi:alkylation response protein AidB-like acyl-CoA dehydrogenase